MDTNKNETARKKRRLSDDIKQPSTASGTNEERISVIERGTLWMDDGNIVLQAGQMQFRVHRSMLSRCSSVFKDMFSLPQPTDSLTDVEGCAVVHLHDSAKDVAYLLTTIYNHQYSVDPVEPEYIEVPKFSALLRLANKYDIPLIRKNMLRRIHTQYPSTFEDFCRGDFSGIRYSRDRDIVMVNLLHDEGVFSALPLALYSAIDMLTVEQIINGYTLEDGTKVTLPLSMISLCLTGKDNLKEFMWETSHKWLMDCVDKSFCATAACQKIFRVLTRTILCPNSDLSFALSYDWKELKSAVDSKDLGLCGKCEKMAKAHYEEGREVVFDELPDIFGFKSWDNVGKRDRHKL